MVTAYKELNWYITLLYYVGVPLILLLILLALVTLINSQNRINKEFKQLNRSIKMLAMKNIMNDKPHTETTETEESAANVSDEPQLWKCSNCGNMNPPWLDTCSKCGYEEFTDDENDSGKTSLYVGIIIAVIIIISVVFLNSYNAINP